MIRRSTSGLGSCGTRRTEPETGRPAESTRTPEILGIACTCRITSRVTSPVGSGSTSVHATHKGIRRLRSAERAERRLLADPALRDEQRASRRAGHQGVDRVASFFVGRARVDHHGATLVEEVERVRGDARARRGFPVRFEHAPYDAHPRPEVRDESPLFAGLEHDRSRDRGSLAQLDAAHPFVGASGVDDQATARGDVDQARDAELVRLGAPHRRLPRAVNAVVASVQLRGGDVDRDVHAGHRLPGGVEHLDLERRRARHDDVHGTERLVARALRPRVGDLHPALEFRGDLARVEQHAEGEAPVFVADRLVLFTVVDAEAHAFERRVVGRGDDALHVRTGDQRAERGGVGRGCGLRLARELRPMRGFRRRLRLQRAGLRGTDRRRAPRVDHPRPAGAAGRPPDDDRHRREHREPQRVSFPEANHACREPTKAGGRALVTASSR